MNDTTAHEDLAWIRSLMDQSHRFLGGTWRHQVVWGVVGITGMLGTYAGVRMGSGTLIAPNVVVTAEHCRDVTRVFLKGNDVDVPQDGETIPVVKSYTHPHLDLRVLILGHDSTVEPRKMAHGAMIRKAKRATVAGFGTITLRLRP